MNRMRSEQDARRTRKIRLKSGNSETHTREEQRGGRVKQDVADVEPERLEAWHLVVGSAKNTKYFRILTVMVYNEYLYETLIADPVWNSWCKKVFFFTPSSLAFADGGYCGLVLAGTEGPNPAGIIGVCLLWILYVVRQNSLRRTDPPSRGILPILCHWVW